LTRTDWLSILGIPEERIPRVLLLRGTRNLKSQYELHRKYFTNVREVGSPNGIIEDVLIGEFENNYVAYASIYGSPMASEIVHIFGVLGTPLVVLTGCCGALADEIGPGDLILATEAFCGEGAARYYDPDHLIVRPSLNPRELPCGQEVGDVPIHFGGMYTTAALLAEGEKEIEAWFADGWAAVDMETATVFALARHFKMDSLAIHFAFDNPRRKRHILMNSDEEACRRRRGNEKMIEVALDIVRDYLS
jgi:purine-nucleoside phosphorylase